MTFRLVFPPCFRAFRGLFFLQISGAEAFITGDFVDIDARAQAAVLEQLDSQDAPWHGYFGPGIPRDLEIR